METEFEIIASRSSGKGGQNVNKVSTKIELHFDVVSSEFLNNEEKEIIQKKLSNRISKEGRLIVKSQDSRSQFMNKEDAINKFYLLLEQALKKEKPRKETKPTKSSKEARLKIKKVSSEKKKNRRYKNFDTD
ncbi:MAG: aminoacyl-tRNA hydrolase [Ignavibacteria bacterium]|nr:aminoacyl-tRNA hydrolase [Ignavibacteria bacterium]